MALTPPNRRCSPRAHNGNGFSLIELAVVIAVVGLLLGAILVPLSKQVELRQLAREQQNQRDLRDALIGFAMVNRRLPCPDYAGDGDEDLVTPASRNGPCVSPPPLPARQYSFLPYVTLGVRPTDTWDRLYIYQVDPDFVLASNPGAPPNGGALDLDDLSTIEVWDRNTVKVRTPMTKNAAAILVSAGPNGHGSKTLNGPIIAQPTPPPALLDEAENLDGNAIFVLRNRTEERANCSDSDPLVPFFCEFDDIVTWIPNNLLKLRMVEAGVLP